jgi:hypothetical protein
MKKISLALLFAFFCFMAPAAKAQCLPHTANGLQTTLLTQVSANFTYPLKDASAVSWTQDELVTELARQSGSGRFKPANGAVPDLSVKLTISNTNGQAPFNVVMELRTKDGGFLRDTFSQLKSSDALIFAVALRVNMYMILGWTCK